MHSLLRELINVLLVALIGVAILLIFIFGQPYHRGFFCNDPSIRHPFKPSTISNSVLYAVGFSVPLGVILLVEVAWSKIDRSGVGNKDGRLSFFYRVYRSLGAFLFGAVGTQFLTDVAKYSIGRLRPHFWTVCQPDVDCSAVDPLAFVEDYKCLGGTSLSNRESRLSFLSGHASFSSYSMLFAVAYLELRWPLVDAGPRILRHFLQFLLIAMAWFTSLSRVSDYMHHPTDVMAGALLGAVAAFVAVFVVGGRFRERRDGMEFNQLMREEMDTRRYSDLDQGNRGLVVGNIEEGHSILSRGPSRSLTSEERFRLGDVGTRNHFRFDGRDYRLPGRMRTTGV